MGIILDNNFVHLRNQLFRIEITALFAVREVRRRHRNGERRRIMPFRDLRCARARASGE